ncbi:MAG: hypothetical protein F6K54_40065 [Okeania sp. SIO3B5]|uniref:hypothetical protein n=1 Tax=Okeania sp. SIO3B5 TaxID=2607811 RepID=UPI0014005C68|nr:hypothetical protein [Okeania sp. SIO3B5]NEO58697.1 hypothetical protein [Okeania sp. SIO3B5]
MNENLDPDLPEKKILPYSQTSESKLISLPNTKNYDLELINQVLAERTRKAETIQDIEKIVKLLPDIDKLKENQLKQNLVIFQIEESQKQADFNRKIATSKELTKIVASITGIGVGLYLMPTAPLFGPLLIILGLASPLQYSLREVANLWESMVNSTKNSALSLLSPDQAASDQTDNSDQISNL